VFPSVTSTFSVMSWDGTTSGGVATWQSITTSVTPQRGPQPPSLFYDHMASRVVYLDGYSNSYYEFTGTNWVQRFPAMPFALGGFGVCECSIPGKALCLTYTQVTLTTGYYWLPRTVLFGGGQASELFLASYPSVRNTPIVYDTARQRFVLVGTQNAGLTDTWELSLGPSAGYSTFGAGCVGSRGTPSLAPQSGASPRISTNFTVQVSNMPLSGPTFMFFGFSDTTYGTTPLP